MDLDFVMRRYEWELDRKDKITSAVSFPVTVLIFLGGVVVTMAKTLSYRTTPVTIGYFIAMLFWFGIVLVCLAHLGGAYQGQTYRYIPNLDTLKNWWELAKREDVRADADELTSADLTDMFNDILVLRIIEAGDENRLANETRQAYLDQANVLLLVTVIMTAMCGVFYVADQILK